MIERCKEGITEDIKEDRVREDSVIIMRGI